jgi:protein O-GlcNAc transferase
MKIITFSLWGTDLKYLLGAIKNAELAQSIYPGWECRFYVDALVPTSIVSELESLDNTKVISMNEIGDWRSSFWRFEDIDDEDVELMISRDTDSRLNMRERAAVDEWIDSNYGFHIMKDHPWHYTTPILAGMFGIKSGVFLNMREKIKKQEKINFYGCGQEFLKHTVYPSIVDDCLSHDLFYGNNFPTQRQGLEFVGQVFDEHDNTVEEHLKILEQWIQKKG